MLRYDHWERVTAAEALAHPYFSKWRFSDRKEQRSQSLTVANLWCCLDNVRLETPSKSTERFSDSGFCST